MVSSRRRASLILALATAVASLATSACATLHMKPPTAPVRVLARPVSGHVPSHTTRDSALSIGTSTVGDVTGTVIYPAGLTASGRMPEQTHWSYQYQVREGKRALRGECEEDVGEVRYYGLGETTLDVSCRCFSGPSPVAEGFVRRGAGKATLLPGHRFAVFGTRGAQNGDRAREILGYRFQSGKSVGAIDVTKAAVAYYGENLSPDEQHALTCLYAGLLLHRARR